MRFDRARGVCCWFFVVGVMRSAVKIGVFGPSFCGQVLFIYFYLFKVKVPDMRIVPGMMIYL